MWQTRFQNTRIINRVNTKIDNKIPILLTIRTLEKNGRKRIKIHFLLHFGQIHNWQLSKALTFKTAKWTEKISTI